MFRQKNQQAALTPNEQVQAARKMINPYQLYNPHRLTGGRDHWFWYLGRIWPKLSDMRKAFVLKHLEHPKVMASELARTRLLGNEVRGLPVNAFILDGRWVARCECGGQEVVDWQAPLFTCLNPVCLNGPNEYYPRPVIFPSVQEHRELSEVLLARPNPINRNWDRDGVVYGKSESIDDLRAENEARGYPPAVEVEERN
jgi:hypothetical protein